MAELGVMLDSKAVVSGAFMVCSCAVPDDGYGSSFKKLTIPDDNYNVAIDPSQMETVNVRHERGDDFYNEKVTKLKDDIEIQDINIITTSKTCGPSGSMVHEYDCVPYKNIPSFGMCTSPYYVETLTDILSYYKKNEMIISTDDFSRIEIYEKLLKQQEERIKNARYRVNTKVDQNPCALALLDRWFATSATTGIDSNNEIASVNNFSAEILKVNRKIGVMILPTKLTLESLRKASNELNSIFPSTLVGEFLTKQDRLLAILEKLSYLLTPQIVLFGSAPADSEPLALATEALDLFKYFDQMRVEYAINNNINQYVYQWEGIYASIQTLMGKAGAPKKAVNNYLTTNSYLVCQCGGIITFKSSGQIRMNTYDNLFPAIKNILLQAQADVERRKSSALILAEKAKEQDYTLTLHNIPKNMLDEMTQKMYADAYEMIFWYLHNVMLAMDEDAEVKNYRDTPEVVSRMLISRRRDAVQKEKREEALWDTANIAIDLYIASIKGGSLTKEFVTGVLTGNPNLEKIENKTESLVQGEIRNYLANKTNNTNIIALNGWWAKNKTKIMSVLALGEILEKLTYDTIDLQTLRFEMKIYADGLNYFIYADIGQDGSVQMLEPKITEFQIQNKHFNLTQVFGEKNEATFTQAFVVYPDTGEVIVQEQGFEFSE